MLNKNMDTNMDTNIDINMDTNMDSKNDLYYLGNNYLNLGSLNTNNKEINVILYNINKSAEIPFLNFILQKKEKTLNPIKYKFLDYSTPFKIQENIVKNIDFINNVIYTTWVHFFKVTFNHSLVTTVYTCTFNIMISRSTNYSSYSCIHSRRISPRC